MANRVKPFTIYDLAANVKWDGSNKHLARFLKLNPLVGDLGKKLVAGQYVNLYCVKADSGTGSGSLYGLE